MAKKHKDKPIGKPLVEVFREMDEADPAANTQSEWIVMPDLKCDSCHGEFDTVVYHPKAPGVPLCARCYRIMERQHTRVIQTPSNPERV